MTGTSDIKLKVCGMRDPANVTEVGSLLPEFMGFIFFRGSKRFVGDDFEIPAALPHQIARVGVFVNASVDEMLSMSKKHRLTLLQLHGNESPALCEIIRKSGVQVIKVFSVDDNFDFNVVKPFKAVADFFLFDTKGRQLGGNGVPFNWKSLARYDQEIPFFLSGGISQANIQQALDLAGMNLHALDINSGVEQAVGVKDIGMIKSVQSIMDPRRTSIK